MGPDPQNARRGAAGRWTLLLPAAYLVHLLEEWFAGEGILEWAARLTGQPMAAAAFFFLNGLTFPLFLVTTILAVVFRSWRWIPISWGALILVNGILHLLGTLATGSYFPGVVSGLLLYLPLGALALGEGHRRESVRTFGWAVTVGVGYHALVMAIALG